jgi:D,D-heptose 1,7-bisphosphate phosphatase
MNTATNTAINTAMNSAMNTRPALFADRDGTIVIEKHYLADPNDVALVPGAAHALKQFAEHGYKLIIVTNQSGIARGLYTEDDFTRVQARIEELLAREGVTIDGVYHCPHHPDISGACDCRKPSTGLYLHAARDHGIDVARSIYTGDRRKDVEPAKKLGGRGILVKTGYGTEEAEGYAGEVAGDLADVAYRVLCH